MLEGLYILKLFGVFFFFFPLPHPPVMLVPYKSFIQLYADYADYTQDL